jgi:opacity protein-like surface antigen
MKKLIICFLLSFTATGVFAQAKNIQGFTIGVNGSSVGSSTNINGSSASIDMGQQTFIPSAELGYYYGVADAVIGLTATYDFVNTKAGQATVNSDSINLVGKNHYSVNLKPGYAITPSTLIYATVGYNSIKGEITGGVLTGSANFSGVGYGVGVVQLVDRNVFLKAEIQQISYESKVVSGVTYQPSSTVGTVGIGYKF